MSEDQKWHPYYLGNPVYAFLLMVLFQYGVALHELETERIRSGEISLADKREVLEGIWRKTKKQTLKDYVAFPLLAGPFAPWVFTGNLTANLIRNVWSYMIIFCGHFPDGTQEFTIEETKAETRGQWYFRQILGSANLSGGKLFHMLSGNLSFQIEHHLFPDIPAHRYAEISAEVREICKRYGIPYNSGPLPSSSPPWCARSSNWLCRRVSQTRVSPPDTCKPSGGAVGARRARIVGHCGGAGGEQGEQREQRKDVPRSRAVSTTVKVSVMECREIPAGTAHHEWAPDQAGEGHAQNPSAGGRRRHRCAAGKRRSRLDRTRQRRHLRIAGRASCRRQRLL